MHFWDSQYCECSSIYMYFCKFVILLYLNLAGMRNIDIRTVLLNNSNGGITVAICYVNVHSIQFFSTVIAQFTPVENGTK